LTEQKPAAGPEDSEALILVDPEDREIGHLDRAQCHAGPGILHRAFSLLIFNPKGELLLQQRAATKRLWPLYWSNSVCSHPRRGESMHTAIIRRLREELGVVCPLHFLFKFQYQAQFDATGSENELCSVFIGRCTTPVTVNRDEIHATRWAGPDAVATEMHAQKAARFTPWFRLEWDKVWGEHREAVLTM
jgi:isopentenyl-diphosphate delta-isomerase